MGTQKQKTEPEVNEKREAGLRLRAIADEVWQVAKALGYGEESTSLKSISTKLHMEAQKLGG